MRSVEAWLAVAEAHGTSDDIDACRKALIRAKFLLRTLVNTSDYDQRITNLANQRKIPESELKQVDRETLKTLGIIELDAASGPVEIEVSSNLAASFCLAEAPEDNPIITVRIASIRNLQSNSPATMTVLEAADNMRSWSSQSISGPAKMHHQCSIKGKPVFITIERLKNDSFRISAKVGAGT